MSNVLQRFGAGAAALAAPFVVLTASPGALAEDCKQAPPPSRAYITDLSTPVLIADASPAVAQASPANCPPQRDAITVLQERNQRVIDGQEALTNKLRKLTPPGG
jgi:hypothetical protein